MLRWRFGSFRFRQDRELPAAATDAALGLDVEGILMEGFRRVDEWHLIEREIDDFDLVFLRNEDAVASLIASWRPDFVLTVGDNAYPLGSAVLLDRAVFGPYAAVMRASAGSRGPVV